MMIPTRQIISVLLLGIHLVGRSFCFQQGFHYRRFQKIASSRTTLRNLPVDDSLIDEILQVAIEASKAAGSIIKKNSDGSSVVEKKSTSRDLLTEIDPKCEKAIRETVVKRFPDHEFLGK